MKKLRTVLAAAIFVALSAPAFADSMPYFGATTHDGNYWNGPTQDYRPGGNAMGSSAADAFGQASCHRVSVAHHAVNGSIVYRTRTVCR